MNQNINGTDPPVCVIELDDLDLPASPDHGLLHSSRVDDRVRDDCSRELDFSADMLNYISKVLREDDVDDQVGVYGSPADCNVLSWESNLDPQVQSSMDGCPANLDCSDDVLNYIRHILLEDDADEKSGINRNHVDADISSTKSSFDSCIKHMYHDRIEDNVRENALSTNMIPEVHPCSVDSHEDLDFNDDVLKYINHILLEEGVDEKTWAFGESEALQATEQSLYEAMWGQCPVSGGVTDPVSCYPGLYRFGDHQEGANLSSQSFSFSPEDSSSSGGAAVDGTSGSPVSGFEFVDVYRGGPTDMHLNNEVNKGNFGPVVCLSDSEEFPSEFAVEREELSNASTGKKHRNADIPDLLEERSSKQCAVHTESSSLSDELFDKILVFRQEKEESSIREEINKATKAAMHQNQSRGPKGGKRGRKKREGKKNEVDLRSLLTLCVQAVAAEDQRSVNEFLRQIRQHSTPAGDGMQRLAHYFADGLEARMAGAGTQIYRTLINMPVSAVDLLKAYHIYLATCPYRKTSNFFSNVTILNVAENATSLHIVDFGTLYGFQWPSFLHKLSLRRGGPPRVRFTGIDFPCPDFRPSQRIMETGRRLASYAEKFNVPFEFNGFAQKWEAIKLEDIKMKEGEVLVVNCLYRLRYLLDETVIAECPRDIVLNLIRKMNPTAFVLGIMNGGYNGPFFVSRFREALFHYSGLFDALDAVIPRDEHERMLLERVVLGRESMNAIACEGAERIERPETYKQWQVRLGRAGLELLPLNREIMETARNKVKLYHKDFMIDEDGHWLLQGWKGRIAYALSCWKPALHHEPSS